MYISICIFKIKHCSLATDVGCNELHVEAVETFLEVAKFTSKGQFERYTERYSAKFAKFCIRSRTNRIHAVVLENYSEIRKHRYSTV